MEQINIFQKKIKIFREKTIKKIGTKIVSKRFHESLRKL